MKTLTIIKAIGAGVTALYNAVQCAESASHGDDENAYGWSRQFKDAAEEFGESIRGIIPEAEQEPTRPSTPVNNITIEGVDPSRLNEALDEVLKWERSRS